MPARKGLSCIRTSLRQHLHSLPPSYRSPHLKRHLLAKEKERLETEIAQMEQRCRQRRQFLADIEKALADLREQERPTMMELTFANKESKQFKAMTVEY